MEQSIFFQLSLVLALATAVSFVCRLLKQPQIIGYIITGFIVGPTLFSVVHNDDALQAFSQIGIALLLFMVGLRLNVEVIRNTGKPVMVTFLAITVVLGALGFGASWLLGFSFIESLLMAVALLFSSTIIVVKALSDKKGHSRLYGQIAIGILLVEDVVATIALLFVSAVSGEGSVSQDILLLALKGIGLGIILTIMGTYVLPRFSKIFAGNQELLFLFVLAWAFGVASAFWGAGFSLEVGALFAGVTLAHLPYAQEMGTRLKSLRDFFIILFFISLGIQLDVQNAANVIVPALFFSVLVMVSKPLLTMASLGVLGYTKQTSFKASIHLSQISEFSIILIVLAHANGLVDQELTTIMTLTALITIASSTYLMQYDDKLYRKLRRVLSVFERSETKAEVGELSQYPLVLIGYRKGGQEFIRAFKQMKRPYVVIDFDPDVIDELEHKGIRHIYGDATDLELLDEIGVHRSEIIISTVNDASTNQILADHLKQHNKHAIFICHANTFDEAEVLYKSGAAYVIVPHLIGTEQISTFIRKHGNDKKAFARYRRGHLLSLGSTALK